MSRWGRGGIVGINKAIYEHERMLEHAAKILSAEHGKRHQHPERIDLCPKCQAEAARQKPETKEPTR